MGYSPRSVLRSLDHHLHNRTALSQIRDIFEKIEKCCTAIDRNLNLADVIFDESNYRSLERIFGKEGVDVGIQLIIKLSLDHYTCGSFSTLQEIRGNKQFEFIYRSVGGWHQFDAVYAFLMPKSDFDLDHQESKSIILVNPKKELHWKKLSKIPADTLVTLFYKTVSVKRSHSQENLAIERVRALFDLIQNRKEVVASPALAEIRAENLESHNKIHTIGSSGKDESEKLKARVRKSFADDASRALANVRRSGKLSMSFEVIVNKMDTFVHAGNAQLIVGHLSDYSGRVEMFVMRDEKVPVLLEADSIWGAEIRNGEKIIFEFYGPKPKEDFMKELASKINKYTQMDKIVNG